MKGFASRISSISCLTSLLMISLFATSRSQESLEALRDKGYLALTQAITDLQSNLTLMSVAAHPDDEDIETLTYYRRKYGVKTVVVNATRGEGGQNEIGPELYRDLGVIRTYEMERSGAISGATYYNLNLHEFGYSKSADETFEKWGREAPLRKLVLLIRRLRPDVIITNHDTTSGHGHHQATGILIRRAFDLAGNPSTFPDQLSNGVTAWQPKRLYQRVSSSEPAALQIPVGDFDRIRGESYARIAARALSEQRSQGMDFFAQRIHRGRRFRYYKKVKAVDSEATTGPELTSHLPNIFETLGADSSRPDVSPLAAARRHTLSRFPGPRPELKSALVDELHLWREFARGFGNSHSLGDAIESEMQKLENALYHTLSLDFELSVGDARVVRGQTVQLHTRLFNGSDSEVQIKSARLMPRTDWLGTHSDDRIVESELRLGYNDESEVTFDFLIPDTAPYTVPKTKIFYETARWRPLFEVEVVYGFGGLTLSRVSEADLDIVPVLGLTLESEETIVPLGQLDRRQDLVVSLRNNSPHSTTGQVGLEWKSESFDGLVVEVQTFSFKREDEQTALRFQFSLPAYTSLGDLEFRAWATFSSGNATSERMVRLGRIRIADIRTIPGLKVGLVTSYDSTLETALEQLGIEFTLLNSEDLLWGDLSQFDTIILDIRAYLMREDLRRNNSRVLNYVHNGGNLVVMYQKTFEWNPEYGNPSWAPYSLVLSRQRVTREDAPVRILLPEHPLLNLPNKIGEDDWQGWIQERGLYFPDRWNAHYESLIATSDPQEPDHEGSYLVAHYGKGTYIYTSLVWYRQLRALVPGAFRNLANMVAFARTRKQYVGDKR